MNKQHGLLVKMLCICLATVLMIGSVAVISFAAECPEGAHVWGEWQIYANGTHTRRCTVEGCGKTETGAHTGFTNNEETNTHTGTCAVCGYSATNGKHVFRNIDNKDNKTHTPTCFCGMKENAVDHRSSVNYTKRHDPTCTDAGWLDKICLDCNAAYTERYLAALGHDYQWKVTKNRTLFEAGEKTWTCWRCGETTDPVKTEEIPSIMQDIGAWIAGAFGFAGHVAYEPIRWIVQLFYNPVEN